MSTSTGSSTHTRTATRRQGALLGGMPYLSLGSGPPLIFLPGLSAHHEPPVGLERRFQAQQLQPFAEHRRVWWVNRRPGLATDVTMADLARDYADALRRKFGRPVDIVAVSTGGSIALQLAVDHPDVVRRLVVVSAAYRLGDRGARAQRRVADEVQAGRPRRAAAAMLEMLGANVGTRGALGSLGWLMGRAMLGKATPDMVATIHAEDDFNLRDRLHKVTASTLVVGGDRDAFYRAELFRETAGLIPRGRLLLYEGKGHLGTSMNSRLVADVLAFLNGREERREAGSA